MGKLRFVVIGILKDYVYLQQRTINTTKWMKI